MRTREIFYRDRLTYKLIYNLSKGFAKLYFLAPSIRVPNSWSWLILEHFENNKREARKLYNYYNKKDITMRTKILKNIVFLSLNKEIIHNEKTCDLCKPIKDYWATTLFKLIGNASWVLFFVYDADKDVYIIRAYKYTTARGLWGREFSADTCGRADMDKALEPYHLRTILIKNLLFLTKK